MLNLSIIKIVCKRFIIILLLLIIQGNISLANSSVVNNYVFQAVKKMKSLDFDGAYCDLCFALNISPYNKNANFYMAKCCFLTQQYFKALNYYQRAYQYGYKNFEANLMLAILYEKLSDIALANYHYKLALKQNPKSRNPNIISFKQNNLMYSTSKKSKAKDVQIDFEVSANDFEKVIIMD